MTVARRGRRRRRGRASRSRCGGTRLAVGKPSSRPRLSPCTTSPCTTNGAPSRRSAYIDGAAEHEPADVRRADDLAVDLQQRHDARLEALVGGEHVGVALRLVAEAEVLAHADVRGAERPDQHLVDELGRRARGELLVERDDDELVDADPLQQLRLALERRQQRRRGVRRRRSPTGAGRTSARCRRRGSPRGGRGERRRTCRRPRAAGAARRRGGG